MGTETCFCQSCIGVSSGRTPEEALCAICMAPTGEPRTAHWILYTCSAACAAELSSRELSSRETTSKRSHGRGYGRRSGRAGVGR